MKTRKTNLNLATPLKLLVMLGACGFLVAGCASGDVNPTQASANKGYVDFYTEPLADLCWQIERFDERSRDFRQIYWKAEAPSAGVLRLALAPGAYRFRISLLDLGTTGPAEVQGEVVEEKITPVR